MSLSDQKILKLWKQTRFWSINSKKIGGLTQDSQEIRIGSLIIA